jgi:hypothetical protein
MDHLERIDALLHRAVREQALDLSGLVVYTEAATGPYLYTPILAALAGASGVYAIAADSRYGTKEHVRDATREAARRWSVDDRIVVVFSKTRADVARSDIVTNSGFVRPIDRAMVDWMKPTAVVPLMWEPWEFRAADLDLTACRDRGIPVMGTNEGVRPHDLYPYGGFLAMKLLFELGLEGHKARVMLLGGGVGLGRSIHDHFSRVGIDVAWFSDTEPESGPYADASVYFEAHGADVDVLVVAEHARDQLLLGRGGVLDLDRIRSINPALAIGVISGRLDREALAASGLRFFPPAIAPFGTMSYQGFALGPRPVLELYAAGLKVGEAMARARLRGLSVDEARAYAARHSPAVDMPPVEIA